MKVNITLVFMTTITYYSSFLVYQLRKFLSPDGNLNLQSSHKVRRGGGEGGGKMAGNLGPPEICDVLGSYTFDVAPTCSDASPIVEEVVHKLLMRTTQAMLLITRKYLVLIHAQEFYPSTRKSKFRAQAHGD